ncbi:MAG: DUF4258 domain-containing protein [Proteobacteria bacterium]|nr:DUF4258 domain-containing protein [Pseudomonadota bacterium]
MDRRLCWNNKKNEKLLKERNISFEMISRVSEDGNLLDIINNPARPGQRMLVVRIAEYAVVVPFVVDEEDFFLKTAYHSRKFTKTYLR